MMPGRYAVRFLLLERLLPALDSLVQKVLWLGLANLLFGFIGIEELNHPILLRNAHAEAIGFRS
jgi:hypothetical protein